MRQLCVMIMLQHALVAFPMLPYIQIDYAHYFRLAQCQAMCTQKCESGCQQIVDFIHEDTHEFWHIAHQLMMVYVFGPSALPTANSVVDEEFGESVDGFLSISLIRPVGPARFVVQWKQRTVAKGHHEESQWITASVEHDTLLRVRGLFPGIQYRFMVTAVGPSGKLGDTVASKWTEISNNLTPKAPANSLKISNGYNSDRGVVAHLQWSRTPLDSCYYRLQLSNSTSQITTEITLDSSPSIILPNLEFDTSYLVTIAAVSADKTQTSKSLTTHFRSLQCKDVYGRGSLQCLPEPVSDLAIVHRPNGTGLISWKPSTDPQNVLFYQVVYYALTHNNGCQMRRQIVNVKATAMSVEVTFPGTQCENSRMVFQNRNTTCRREYYVITRDLEPYLKLILFNLTQAHCYPCKSVRLTRLFSCYVGAVGLDEYQIVARAATSEWTMAALQVETASSEMSSSANDNGKTVTNREPPNTDTDCGAL
ncbi:hypothetical protein KIN20_022340 [Parelaphostrongylus tenuis]|uniref:Fibronectin type-III domain-containing protein n=1 Tax=Parelaphostrongylus tenuis TaxID=148309 RepID=A0AAD5N8W0_PARTN|nr:hypothetical protein KIN20_022340 [Parelaphostrongylus tenuis]